MKKAALILLALSSLVFYRASAQRTISKVTLDFYTTNDDKDHDTGYEIWLKSADNSVLAHGKLEQSANITYGNNSDNYFELNTAGNYNENDLPNGKVDIKINTVGHDTWRFDLYITVHYTNGETSEFRTIGWDLNQDSPTISKIIERR